MRARRRNSAGITLIELIVFIVIVGVALAGVLTSLNVASRASAETLAPKQSLAIAEALMAEILAQNYCDPDASATDYSTSPPTCGTNSVEAGGRTDYDAIEDYSGYTQTDASSMTGTHTFTGYAVSVAVSTTTLGPTPVAVRQVRVTVTPASGTAINLTGYKANY